MFSWNRVELDGTCGRLYSVLRKHYQQAFPWNSREAPGLYRSTHFAQVTYFCRQATHFARLPLLKVRGIPLPVYFSHLHRLYRVLFALIPLAAHN